MNWLSRSGIEGGRLFYAFGSVEFQIWWWESAPPVWVSGWSPCFSAAYRVAIAVGLHAFEASERASEVAGYVTVSLRGMVWCMVVLSGLISAN